MAGNDDEDLFAVYDPKPASRTGTASRAFPIIPDVDLAQRDVALPQYPQNDPRIDATTRAAFNAMYQLPSETLDALQNLVTGAGRELKDVIDDGEAFRRSGRVRRIVANDIPIQQPKEPRPLMIGAPNSGNVPAVVNAAAKPGRRADWHQIRHLPAQLMEPLRALGRQVFSNFTDVPVEDIQMLSTFMGCPEREMRHMAHWIRSNGEKMDTADLDFGAIVPGARSAVERFRAERVEFLLVKDQGGEYVYAWPAAAVPGIDADRRAVMLEGPETMATQPARLR